MKLSIASIASVGLIAASVVGCDKPGVTEQQRENRAAEQAASAHNDAVQQATSAQANAEKNIASAQLDFEKNREDYRHMKRQDLTDLDKKIVEMETDARTATGKKKAELQDRLPTIRAQRDAFVRHMQELDTATPTTWDTTKANLDKEWDSLKSAVSSAR